ncbi:MAG: VacJ family lipoprotein [Magnetospirillum sp. WYHS-4]
MTRAALFVALAAVFFADPAGAADGSADSERPVKSFSRARFNAELEQAAIEAAPASVSAKARESQSLRFDTGDLMRQAEEGWTRIKAAVRDRLRVPAIERARALGELPATAVAEEGEFNDRLFRLPPDEEYSALEDPMESLNRQIHAFNMGLIDNLFEPVADFYYAQTTRPTQIGVSNFFSNLREPITIGSALLQGDFDDAGASTARFLINSTYGILGIYDRAAELGYPRKVRTLDETFCSYGVASGPYFVMPVFGPSTARDTTARLTTMFGQYLVLGLYVIPYRVFDTASQYFDVRERMQFINTLAVDSYSRYRSVYAQVTQLSCEHQPEIEKEMFTR